MMIKKNLFGFVAFAAAAGCSLLVTGCGNSSGSTSASSIAGSSYVQFKYTSLASSAARTDLKAEIAAVRYNFTDPSGAQVTVSDKYSISHGEAAEDITVTVPGVGVDAAVANAVYYDVSGNIIAAGVDKITWSESSGSSVGIVSSPEVNELGDCVFTVEADRTVIAPKEKVNIAAFLVPENSQESVNVTPFATISGIDPSILKEAAGGAYEGADYGFASGIKANMAAGIKALSAELEGGIYVTDQQIESIAITPVSGELNEKSTGKFTYLAYVENDLGLTEITSPIDKKVYALNEEEFVVEAVYSDTKGKGPVPAPQNVTSDSILTLTASGVAASENKAVVTVSDFDAEADAHNVAVKASYIPSAEAELLEDEITIEVAAPSVNIGLAYEGEEGATLDVTAAAGDTAELYLKGIFSWPVSSEKTFMDFVDIAEDKLPAAAAAVTLSSDLSSADVSLEAAEDSVVEYILSVPTGLSSDAEGTADLAPIDGLPGALSTNISVKTAE
ncbi:hypothetical protein IJT93_12215 [bacterium]|nr:hypothetical protein [bacterium]